MKVSLEFIQKHISINVTLIFLGMLICLMSQSTQAAKAVPLKGYEIKTIDSSGFPAGKQITTTNAGACKGVKFTPGITPGNSGYITPIPSAIAASVARGTTGCKTTYKVTGLYGECKINVYYTILGKDIGAVQKITAQSLYPPTGQKSALACEVSSTNAYEVVIRACSQSIMNC